MNEDAAREVLLVRALETTEASRELIGEVDRLHAGRTAAELARWHSNSAGTPPSADVFLARRAGLLLEKLATTQPALARASRALAWRPGVGVAVAVVAPLVGLLAEQVADRDHVNILAFPLLLIVGWNFVVYVVIAMQSLRRLATRPPRPGVADEGTRSVEQAGSDSVSSVASTAPSPSPSPSPEPMPTTTPAPTSNSAATPPAAAGALRGTLLALAQRSLGGSTGPLAPALRRFGTDWSRAMVPLATARAARLLHLAAALLALGAVVGLYLRGLVFEYRIGWESTFLGAAAVHALLATVLGPAAALLGIAFPGVAEIEAIRFPASTGGVRAANWIHLHALTVLLAVIVPRALLFTVATVRERQLAQRLPLDLRAPYFRRLLGPLLRGDARLRVVPYSYTVDEPTVLGLRTVAQRLLGEGAGLSLAPTVGYGDELRAAEGLLAADPQVPLTLALFNLAATPEAENHGEFLENLARGLVAPLAVLVDEGPYRRRLGTAVDTGAASRLEERRQAWQAFAATRSLAIACVDLATPDLDMLERRFEPALAGDTDARRGVAP